MKRIFVNEERCLGCRLCEWECAFANSGLDRMFKLKNRFISEFTPRIRVEGEPNGKINFAVSCRHCTDPVCVHSCIAGALFKDDKGVVGINRDKCVGCFTCVLVCPYGAIMPAADGKIATKCELCTDNSFGEPNCVKHCPNRAIVYEER